ncbi:Ig-like domain-containing protein [Ferrimonas sp. SCSIO 43195]|uniref:Ig-like domain-containing protein n=1 Tax=Ferrimonas sp. SCSIO 43195 TaxID=2822844 RepID=UPI0020752FFB|nr:cadherin-like domain-containing protein [Ferrimonas sp. SCSIO 43195]USD38132.1 cadherin-like domain-containing protein [Ferrimonas sp. SCSIO 43195]
MMMKPNTLNAPMKTLAATALLSLLTACGSDSDNNSVAPPPPQKNAAPIATADTAEATVGSQVIIDVLANDSDADGDPLTLDRVDLVTGNGRVSIEDNKLLFEPEKTGEAKLAYEISDGRGGEARSTVTVTIATEPAEQLSYVGTQTCLSCHNDKESFLTSGPPFKLAKVVDGQMPEYPFTNIAGALEMIDGVINPGGAPTSYEEVAYVIGGYKQAVQWVGLDGYIITGEKVIGKLDGDGYISDIWSFGENLGPEVRPYHCGRCHTTGWKDFTSAEGDNRNNHHQDGLEGILGTFDQTGVQCESCHGAGSDHIKSPSSNNITRLAEPRTAADMKAEDQAFGQAVACAECHTKKGDKTYPEYLTHYTEKFGGYAVGGLIPKGTAGLGGLGGRIAGDAIMGYNPDTGVAEGKKQNMHCSTCHESHMSTHFRDKPGHEGGLKRECTDCHQMEFANAEGGNGMAAMIHSSTDCRNCHMPSRSHLFKIDISAPSDDSYHYSEDGVYSQPWLRPSDACQGCHAEDYDARAAQIGKIHK